MKKYKKTIVNINSPKLSSGSNAEISVAPIRIGMTIPDVNGMYDEILINNVSGFDKPVSIM